MPFTISHAAAAVPFQRTRLVLSAIIVGSMAPDFEYFIHGRMTSRWSHTLPGVFEFSLPAALIVLAAFHYILKRPVVALLPTAVQRRITLGEFSFWPLPRFLLITASALVGVATHLLWDSFTHPGAWAVEHISWFHETTVVLGRPLTNYKLSQHGSTLLGLGILFAWFLWWFRSTESRREVRPVFSAWSKSGIVIAIIVIAAVLGIFRALNVIGPHPFSVGFVANAVVMFVSVTMLEMVIFSLAVRHRVSS
ncbi:MAG TPA: DUF4184 family protein [Terriglobales bacterium]